MSDDDQNFPQMAIVTQSSMWYGRYPIVHFWGRFDYQRDTSINLCGLAWNPADIKLPTKHAMGFGRPCKRCLKEHIRRSKASDE